MNPSFTLFRCLFASQLCVLVAAFTSCAIVSPSKLFHEAQRCRLFQSKSSDSSFVRRDRNNRYEYENETAQSQIAKIFGSGDQFVPLSLAGRSTAIKNDVPIDILLFSDPYDTQLIQEAYQSYLQNPDKEFANEYIEALPIPLSPNDYSSIRLLSHALASTPLTKTQMLVLNSILVNRDGGLFDNLPWAKWTIDPDYKERDAARNIVDEKYAMGKRVAYQRMMGKDWRRSLSSRLKEVIEPEDESYELLSATDEDLMASLSKRILEVEVEDARTEVAGFERELAVKRTQLMKDGYDDDSEYSTEQKLLDEARSRLQVAESSLENLIGKAKGSGSIRSTLKSILTKLDRQVNEAPYRGAIGYPAKKESSEDRIEPYTSPYSLLLEIIDEQLNAEVVACVLERVSLFEGNLVLGGALLLKRKVINKSTTIAGERVDYMDSEGDLGNEGLSPQSLYVVECFTDEAVGATLEVGLPIYIESSVWDRAGDVRVEIAVDETPKNEFLTAASNLPILRPSGSFHDISIEGERVPSSEDAKSVRIPLPTNAGIFDSTFKMMQPLSTAADTSVFSTYSPVGSLDEYDSLTDDDKARILLKMESFQGKLPRPRVVRSSTPSALDTLLLPLIDESVRRQYLIRDAEERGDIDTANSLRAAMSPRQSLLERARAARESGFEEEAERLENEAELLKATKADFTQDEGSYSKFLDRDDWYERETQARIARYKKSKGIE